MNRELLEKLRGMKTLGVRTELESIKPDTGTWTANFNRERNAILDITDESSDDFYEVSVYKHHVSSRSKKSSILPGDDRVKEGQENRRESA